MSSKFFFSLHSIKPQVSSPGGELTNVTSDHVPGFENISFSSLRLNRGGAVEPIWHPNAQKIGYCLEGAALISFRSPTAVETFTVEKGDVFFIPKGYIHQISNSGDAETLIKFTYNHSKPEVMTLSNALCSLSGEVFTATFNAPGDFVEGLKKSKKGSLITTLPEAKKAPGCIASRFKFNIARSSRAIVTKGGYLQLATKTNLHVLDGLGILGFGLNPKGAVEPHWHTNAGELVYIVKGHTLITILSPGGKVETLEVKGGEGAFAPASYFHNILNIGKDEVEVIAFFSHAEPDYIGIGEAASAFSNELLSAVFATSPTYFDALKKPAGPLVIVPV
jgi:oxalate decarboxylase